MLSHARSCTGFLGFAGVKEGRVTPGGICVSLVFCVAVGDCFPPLCIRPPHPLVESHKVGWAGRCRPRVVGKIFGGDHSNEMNRHRLAVLMPGSRQAEEGGPPARIFVEREREDSPRGPLSAREPRAPVVV